MRFRTRSFALIVGPTLLGGFLASPVLAGPTLATETETETETASASRGRGIYNRACAGCHGRSGRGDGPAAASLDPRPRDFTSGKYKFRSTSTGSPPTDDDLYRVVSAGIPRTYMVGWEKLLSERDRRDVVAYIKTFSDVFQLDATPIGVPPETPLTGESIAEGKSVYMILQCWACHGPSGRGDGSSAASLADDWGRSIRAFDFTVGEYKGGQQPESVFRTFEAGLNGTPMPSYAEAFAFGADSVSDLSGFRQVYAAPDVAALSTYLRSQPTSAELAELTPDAKDGLMGRRKWALVHYVRSLSRDTGLMHWLFVVDTETSRE